MAHPLPPIIFYGPPGLEAQVFQSFLTKSGYRVRLVTVAEQAWLALNANPTAILVIALDHSLQEARDLVQRVGTTLARRVLHIFILAEEQPFEVDLPNAEIIPRPWRLSEVIARIRALTRPKHG